MTRAPMLLVVLKVSPDVATFLLVASVVVIVVGLAVAVIKDYGRKGWIAVGGLAAVLVAVAGWSFVARKVALAEREQASLDGVRAVVSAVKELGADTAPTDVPLARACADARLGVNLPRTGGVVVAHATRVTASSMPLVQPQLGGPFETTLDPARVLAPETTVYDLTWDAERLGRSGHVLVLLDGAKVAGTWRGHVASKNLATGAACKGAVEVPAPSGDELKDSEFLKTLCKQAGGVCGG